MALPSVGSLLQLHEHSNFGVLEKFSDTQGYPYYNGNRIALHSQLAPFTEHIANYDIHVTGADKERWDLILQNAKDYADTLFHSIKSFETKRVTELPTGSAISTNTIYFLKNSANVNDNSYTEYMFFNGNWEIVGSTAINISAILEDYVTTSALNAILTNYYTSQNVDQKFLSYYNKTEIDTKFETVQQSISNIHTHNNKQVLDKLSDDNGNLLYNNSPISEDFTDSDIISIIDYLWPNFEYEYNFTSSDNKVIISSDGCIFNAKEYIVSNFLTQNNKVLITYDGLIFKAKEVLDED